MANAKILLTPIAWLLPTAAIAAVPQPPLHVDTSLDDCSVQFAPELTQGAYSRFVREFGSVSAFKLMSPPRPLGQWGVAVGIEGIYFHIDEHADAWNDTFYHPDAEHELGSDKSFPKLRVRVGVTDSVDLGAFYTENPLANYGWVGVEGKYALLRQRATMPIVLSLRAAYTKTIYVDDMDMHALGTDVTVGRTFWDVLTPYAGVGNDVVIARETSDTVELDTEIAPVPHALAGFDARFWHVAVGAEGQLAVVPSFQAQVSATF